MNNKLNKCRYCGNETNTILYLQGERKCLSCLGDYIKEKKGR